MEELREGRRGKEERERQWKKGREEGKKGFASSNNTRVTSAVTNIIYTCTCIPLVLI